MNKNDNYESNTHKDGRNRTASYLRKLQQRIQDKEASDNYQIVQYPDLQKRKVNR